jgi:serine protease
LIADDSPTVCAIHEGKDMRQSVTRRWTIRAASITAATVLVAGVLLASGGPASGASSDNPFAPTANGHLYRHGVVPTQEALANMKNFAAQHSTAAAAAASSSNLTYGGAVDGIGVTTGAPKVYVIFWGSQWGTQSTDSNGNVTLSGDSAGQAPREQQLFKGIGVNSEQWSGVMTEYCEGVATGSQTCGTTNHVGYPTGGALAGVWVDTSAAAPSQATGHQIGVEAVAAASHFGNTTAASNRNAQYVVVSPHNTHPDGFNTSSGNFCAWHDWNGDTTLSGGAISSSVGDIAFTNMPYVTDAGTSCGKNFVNAGTGGNLDGVTIVGGHEYAETITDQNPPGGWTDSSGEENGDKCAWITSGQGASANVAFSTGSFAMQSTWANDFNSGSGGCEISHPIVTNGGGALTVNNPGNQTGTVGVAVSLTVTATGGTTPYTWSATGLPAGLSINASSGAITGTPTAAATSSVTVTATDSASANASASFSWTINAAGGCATGQKLVNPGFESGTSPWSATAGVLGNTSGQTAHSGSQYAWLDGYGTTHTDTLSQSVALPSGCTTYTFSFWLHIDTAETTTSTAFDTLKVQVVNSSGTVLSTLATYSNLNHATGYTQKSFSLASFAGQTVTLKWTGAEDSSLQTSFVVDDTAVNVS